MKIKFSSNDSLPLNKTRKFHNTTIIGRFIFEKGGKYNEQVSFRRMFVWVIKLLQYDRTDVSEAIYINKASASEEFDICHYWYFNHVDYKFQPYICNGYMIYQCWLMS